MLEALLGLCSQGHDDKALLESRGSLEQAEMFNWMLPSLKIKFLRGVLPHLHNFRWGLWRWPFLRPQGSASAYSAPLSGLLCLEPNPMTPTPVAWSNICVYYLPGPMPSMIPNTATCPCLVPDQEPAVRARLPYSISLPEAIQQKIKEYKLMSGSISWWVSTKTH